MVCKCGKREITVHGLCRKCYLEDLEERRLVGFVTCALPVKKLDPETKEVLEVYNSLSEAAEKNFVSESAIKAAIYGNKKSLGFSWSR